MSEAQTTIKTSDMELRHCRTVLKQKESETQSNDAAYNKDKNLLDNLTVEIQGINQKLQGIDYEEGIFETLQERKNKLHNEVRQLQQQLDRRNAYRYELQYRDPEPGFDRSKVRGMVGKLFDVIDESNCLALMMTASGSVCIFEIILCFEPLYYFFLSLVVQPCHR